MPTLIPTRLLIQQRLVALLSDTPLIVQGEEVSLAGHVFRGRNILGEDAIGKDELPALSIMEAPRPDYAVYAGENLEARHDQLTLLISGVVENDVDNPTDPAYYLWAAVEERLSKVEATNTRSGVPVYPNDYMLGNLITSLEVAPPVVRPPEDKVSSKAFFFLPIRVGIGGVLSEPYTSVA